MTLRDAMHGFGSRPEALLRRAAPGCAAIGCAAAAFFSAGCGDSEQAASGEQRSSAVDAEWSDLVRGGSYSAPEDSGPKPQPGKRVWVMSCNQAIENCATPARATMEAAESLGWDVTPFDTRFEPARMAEGFQQAIAARADGIIAYGLDCPLVKASLARARAAGVLTVNASGKECDMPGYDATLEYASGDTQDYVAEYGAQQAIALIHATGGDAKVITVNQADVPIFQALMERFKSTLKERCAGCEVVEEVKFTDPDYGSNLQQKTQQALLQHPDANAIHVQLDSALTGGVSAGLRASGRAQKVTVAAAEGQSSTLGEIRSGRLDAVGIGIPQEWEGWAEVDALNRLFAGEQPVASGIGYQAYDADENMPADGGYEPPLDFRTSYRQAWGLG